ncbi:MAG: helix-turn-helix domain-containing protein [Planctomycetota bacterium]
MAETGGLNRSNQIRLFRFESAEVTPRELAEAAGVTRQTVLTVETSKCSPSRGLAIWIARPLGQRLDDVSAAEDEATIDR